MVGALCPYRWTCFLPVERNGLKTLEELCRETTAYTMEKKGRIVMECEYATRRFLKVAKAEGHTTLVWCRGFFRLSMHHWAKDANGVIYDPTVGQFLYGDNARITPGMAEYGYYDEVPAHLVGSLAHSTSQILASWLIMKPWVTVPDTTVGEHKVEVRISKRGDEYLYVQQPITFTPACNTGLRTFLVFHYKRGYRISVIQQDRRKTEDGRIIHPTSIKRFMVHFNGWVFEASEKGSVGSGGYKPEWKDIKHQFPKEVVDWIKL